MVLNWIIALLALVYYWLKKFTGYDPFDDNKDGKLDLFFKNYLDDIALSVLAVIILGLFVLNVDFITYLGGIINANEMGISVIGKLTGLTLGLLNCWIMEKLTKFTKKTINKKMK